MIRFGTVLTVVLVSMGLLVGGVLANSLLLVYLAIGFAALAAVLLTVGVVIWRGEIFGDSRSGQTARPGGQAPVLASAGAAASGTAATHDDVMVQPPAARQQWPSPPVQRPAGPADGQGNAGEGEASEVEASEVEAGEVEASEVEASEVEASEVEAGEVEAGHAAAAPADAAPAGGTAQTMAPPEHDRTGASNEADQTAASPEPSAATTIAATTIAALVPGSPAPSPAADSAPSSPAPIGNSPPSSPAPADAPGAAEASGAAEPPGVWEPPGIGEPFGVAESSGVAQSSAAAEPESGGRPAGTSPATEVTIVPGIARYHRSGCILIRFLGPEDLESMTIRQAEDVGCVPCKACQPEQELADDR